MYHNTFEGSRTGFSRISGPAPEKRAFRDVRAGRRPFAVIFVHIFSNFPLRCSKIQVSDILRQKGDLEVRNRRRWVLLLLCAAVAASGLGFFLPAHAAAPTQWTVAVSDTAVYRMDCAGDSFSLSGGPLAQAKQIEGTLRGACAWEGKLWMLVSRADGARIASLSAKFNAYQEYPGAGGGALRPCGDAFGLEVSADGTFVYTAQDGARIGYRLETPSRIHPQESWAPAIASTPAQPVAPPVSSESSAAPEPSGAGLSSSPGASAQPAPSGAPASSASSGNAPPIDCGLYRFDGPLTVADLKARYQRLAGSQRPGAQFSVWNARGGEMATGWVPTGSYIAERYNGALQYCTAVIPGDLTGSGRPDKAAFQLLRAAIATQDTSALAGAFASAADMNADGVLDTADLLLLKKQME